MNKILLLAVLVILCSNGRAQKTIHDANVVVRPVSAFHSIEVSGGIDLYLSSGNEALAVSASDKDTRDRIKTEVKDGVLKIYLDWKKGMNFGINRLLKAYVSYKTITSLTASGGSDIQVEGTVKSSRLDLTLSGGSEFSGKVEVDYLVVNQSGGADAQLTGAAPTLSINASGGSDFNGFGLAADICTVHASGGSDIEITVNKEISAFASGASDISWKGKAAVKKSSSSGASSVSHRS